VRFNPVDITCLLFVATVAGIQFLRGTKNSIALIFYETLAIIGAGKVAYEAAKANHSFALFFFPTLILFFILARILYNYFDFSVGVFDILFSFFLGIIGGWAMGFGVMRSFLPLVVKKENLLLMVQRSWMASQIIYLGFFRELFAMLIQAKYHNAPGEF